MVSGDALRYRFTTRFTTPHGEDSIRAFRQGCESAGVNWTGAAVTIRFGSPHQRCWLPSATIPPRYLCGRQLLKVRTTTNLWKSPAASEGACIVRSSGKRLFVRCRRRSGANPDTVSVLFITGRRRILSKNISDSAPSMKNWYFKTRPYRYERRARRHSIPQERTGSQLETAFNRLEQACS